MVVAPAGDRVRAERSEIVELLAAVLALVLVVVLLSVQLHRLEVLEPLQAEHALVRTTRHVHTQSRDKIIKQKIVIK